MIDLSQWSEFVSARDERLLFVTVSGAHLYGFPSPDSDVDLRGCHQLPLESVVGLSLPDETVDVSTVHDGVEVDLVSHDVGKYLRLLVRNNGYVLEQIFSPLVVVGEAFLETLRPIARRCVTCHHYHHYRGFYATQRKLLEKQPNKTAKALLYAYRVLLTGMHLLETGEVEANLLALNDRRRLTFIDELIASKVEEKIAPADLDWSFHAAQLDRLAQSLDEAFAATTLPETRDRQAVNDLLVDLRLGRCGV